MSGVIVIEYKILTSSSFNLNFDLHLLISIKNHLFILEKA